MCVLFDDLNRTSRLVNNSKIIDLLLRNFLINLPDFFKKEIIRHTHTYLG